MDQETYDAYVAILEEELVCAMGCTEPIAVALAAAKARGVKFGRPPIPLPENFRAAYAAWRAKKLTLQQAADACHMKVGTFYDKAVKLEKAP